MRRGTSFGGYPSVAQRILPWRDRDAPLPMLDGPLLAYGNGRSYGDVGLNDGGTVLDARGLDRFMSFDLATGVLRCEAGVLLGEILDIAVPRGWFLPVTPGTQFVTVGGAIANDVHGKNQHRAGSFGDHVRCFELLRSDGARRECRPDNHADLFVATIGGLGLTGLITWVELQLRRVDGPWLDTETIYFQGVSEFLALSRDSETTHEYGVAWIDCAADGAARDRGVFVRANHAADPASTLTPITAPQRRLRLPLTLPFSLVNRWTLRAFNAIYYRAQRTGRMRRHYAPYFYPLDAVCDWNRVYGPAGFFQFQCIVPPGMAATVIPELLARIRADGEGSFLAVLKLFGERQGRGLLSFARAGTTFAIDLANRGTRTLALLNALDGMVAATGGAIYPAKDAHMTGTHFRQYFPHWKQLETLRDPAFSSSFWRRVMADRPCEES